MLKPVVVQGELCQPVLSVCLSVCLLVCVRACVRACVDVCMPACMSVLGPGATPGGGDTTGITQSLNFECSPHVLSKLKAALFLGE